MTEPIAIIDGIAFCGCPHITPTEGFWSDTPHTYFIALDKTNTLALCTVCYQAVAGHMANRDVLHQRELEKTWQKLAAVQRGQDYELRTQAAENREREDRRWDRLITSIYQLSKALVTKDQKPDEEKPEDPPADAP